MANHPQRRPIHLSTLAKRAAAEKAWKEKADKIKRGEEEALWEMFKKRGYVKDMAGTDEQIGELMRRKRIGAYVGIDPTAASLHLGHLLPLMPLFWMYIHGFRAISVLGGATAKVGDPTDRLQTRDEVSKADRSMFITKMHYQLKRIWINVDAQAARFGYEKEWSWNRELLNNSQWYNTTSFVEVVQRLFKRMRIGPMLTRETVKRKMKEGDGMSLAEFVYPSMQAWDWWHMFSGPKGVCMQIGGSDQYGNIVAGIDAVKILRDTEPDDAKKLPNDLLHTPVGFTVPLLTDSSGAKFGKSAGNAMWLDPFMTSSSDLYSYFMRRPDDEIEKLLKLFTFLPLDKIDEIMKVHNEDPPKRHAHHTLAFEVLALVHSHKEAEATQIRHKQMFATGRVFPEPGEDVAASGRPDDMASPLANKNIPWTNDRALYFRPDIQLPNSLILGKSISRILHAAGLATSATDGHRLVAHQGAYVGGAPGKSRPDQIMDDGELTFQSVKNWFPQDTRKFLIDGKILILRRGKHFIRIVEMVSDEEWAASGKTYPGEPGKGRLRMLRQSLEKATKRPEKGRFTPAEVLDVHARIDRLERERGVTLAETELEKALDITFPTGRTSTSARLLDQRPHADTGSQVGMDAVDKAEAIDAVLGRVEAVLDTRKVFTKVRGGTQAPGRTNW